MEFVTYLNIVFKLCKLNNRSINSVIVNSKVRIFLEIPLEFQNPKDAIYSYRCDCHSFT